MKSFTQKQKELSNLKDKLVKSKITIFTSFAREGEKGLSVSQMRELKKELRGVDSEYLVEKKTILDKAIRNIESETRDTNPDVLGYEGSLGVALGYSDSQLAAKSVYNFAKQNPALRYFSAIWDGRFLDSEQFAEFAKLPTKEVMIARLLGMMKYPLQALAATLKQIADKK